MKAARLASVRQMIPTRALAACGDLNEKEEKSRERICLKEGRGGAVCAEIPVLPGAP